MTRTLLTSLCLLTLATPRPASSQDAWSRVDTLKPQTRIVVTLKTGEEDTYYFRRATLDDLTLATGPDGHAKTTERAVPKSLVVRVATHDPVRNGAANGALIGAAGLAARLQLGVQACGTGCENDMPGWAFLGVAAVGAGLGSAFGILADIDAGGPKVLYPPSMASSSTRWSQSNQFFAARPSVRVATWYTRTAFVSPAVEGTALAPILALGVQVSPHLSTHMEYTATNGRFRGAAGSVADAVRQNVVAACRCGAGLSRGIESRHVKFAFSQLVGVHPAPWGRVRLELLAGLGVQAQEDRDYYDANRQSGQGTMSDPRRTERIPGKYYVLNFESPRAGPVAGVNTEIAVTRHVSVVPMVRYNWMGDPGASMVYGVGAHWRF